MNRPPDVQIRFIRLISVFTGPSRQAEEGKGALCSSLSNGHNQFTLSFVSQLGDLSTVSTLDSQV